MRASFRLHLSLRCEVLLTRGAIVRLIHTSDWHLGHTLHGIPRDHEHACFLKWLIATIKGQCADALVITGDVFETHNPSATAQAAWYAFLATAKRECPDLDILVIGGNHDSAERLNAPAPILGAFGIHVVGGLARTADDRLDFERLVVPLHRAGEVVAWVAAVPFLRPADLRGVDDMRQDALQEGVRILYAEVIAAARAKRQPGQSLLATGHCYMSGTSLSELSERKILGGNQHALPADIFPADLAYVALGHLHRAQAVGRAHVRYSGSPIPLSMSELGYNHQVVLVELDGEGPAVTTAIPVPVTVKLQRVPADRARPLGEVISLLEALPVRSAAGREDLRPIVEVCVALDGPQPRLKSEIERALEGKEARLAKITVTWPERKDCEVLAPGAYLVDLVPEDVFQARYRRIFQADPPAPVVGAFLELLETVYEGSLL